MQQNETNENTINDREEQKSYNYEANLKSIPIWKRLMYMLIFAVVFSLCRIVIFGVALLQFFSVLFTSEANKKLQLFGHAVGSYVSEITDFLTYSSEEKPFPFDKDWPSTEV